MTIPEALEKLDQLQAQIIHGGTPFKDIADAFREVVDRAEYAEKAFQSDQRLMFAALTILRDNGIEVGSKELCEAARRLRAFEAMRQWQPIKTAPRDGEVFLAYEPHDAGGFQIVATYTKAGRLVDTVDGQAFPYATHWMPLPNHPENAQAEVPR